MIRLLLLGAVLAAAMCDYRPIPPEPPNATGGTAGGPAATGGAEPGGTGGEAPAPPADDCEAAELKLRALECKHDGEPYWETSAGVPFSVFCRDRAADGDSVCPRCLAAIDDCSEIPTCKPTTPGVCP